VTEPALSYGDRLLPVTLPDAVAVRVVDPVPPPAATEPLGVVARALDAPLGSPPLQEIAGGVPSATIVVPDATRPAATPTTLLPIVARLARAGLGPSRIRVVVARGIHPVVPRAVVERLLGPAIMASLRPVQSTPETPEMNASIGEDEEIGDVRVHRVVAEAGLVVLTGTVLPHHLAGFGGGAKALVPGVAERGTVLAAHRLTLRTIVRPDGSVRSVAGRMDENPFREALVRVARSFGRCFLANVVLGAGGGIAEAFAGEVGEAHAAAADGWRRLHQAPDPEPADLVLVGVAAPRDGDLIQAHKALLAAVAWAAPGAPIVWAARAPAGGGHPRFLPWFQISRPADHLAALRRDFHPYGLTAWSLRRIAADHPVHVVSETSPDVLRPLGLLPFRTLDAAIAHALAHHEVRTAVVLPDPV
jgi:lactate racemase